MLTHIKPLTSISIHAPHTRSDEREATIKTAGKISIHAPHTRSDGRAFTYLFEDVPISIHAPHTRSDSRAGKQV